MSIEGREEVVTFVRNGVDVVQGIFLVRNYKAKTNPEVGVVGH